MASWPGTRNAYPATPKAYPASPKAFPASPNAFPAGGGTSTPMHVLFLAGQSNAIAQNGTDSPVGFPDATIPLLANELGPVGFTYDSGSTPVSLGPVGATTHYSIELVAAKNLQTAGFRMAVAKVTFGGSHLAEWRPGAGTGYWEALLDMKARITAAWGSDAIIHFVWLQSESDALDTDPAKGPIYQTNLEGHVADTLSSIGWREFWQCKIQPSLANSQNGPLVVAAQIAVMAERTDTHLLNFDAVNGSLHYTIAQLNTMGAQIATEIIGANAPAITATLAAVAQPSTFSGTLLAGANATDPLTIVTSKSPLFFLTADAGITIATGVATWADQSGSGKDATQGTGANQPALQSAVLNGKNTVLFDGTNDCLVFTTLDLPAPGTTPTWFFMVFRQVTWVSGRSIYGAGSTTAMRVNQQTSSPNLRANNGASGSLNAGAVVNTFTRLENLFSNSLSDYLKLAATSVTNVNTLNTDAASGAFTLGAHTSAAASPGNIEVACIGAWNGKPTAGELTTLDAWVTAYYGAGVGV